MEYIINPENGTAKGNPCTTKCHPNKPCNLNTIYYIIAPCPTLG